MVPEQIMVEKDGVKVSFYDTRDPSKFHIYSGDQILIDGATLEGRLLEQDPEIFNKIAGLNDIVGTGDITFSQEAAKALTADFFRNSPVITLGNLTFSTQTFSDFLEKNGGRHSSGLVLEIQSAIVSTLPSAMHDCLTGKMSLTGEAERTILNPHFKGQEDPGMVHTPAPQ